MSRNPKLPASAVVIPQTGYAVILGLVPACESGPQRLAEGQTPGMPEVYTASVYETTPFVRTVVPAEVALAFVNAGAASFDLDFAGGQK